MTADRWRLDWHRAEQLALAALQEGEPTNAERYARRGINRILVDSRWRGTALVGSTEVAEVATLPGGRWAVR